MATSKSVKKHKLRKAIAWLSDKKGRGKEFISLYIPPASSIDEVIANLKNQANTNANKHDDTAERLEEATKNIIQHLKLRKEIPYNGLAVFAGTFPANDPQKEVATVEELAPPEPIVTYLYEVNDHFHLEPLREMLRNPRVIGIIAMDSKEASFGLLNGERLELIKNITSGIPGKSGKGGQSQRRYERERDMELTHFFHRIAEHAAKAFLEDQSVMAVIIGGPGTTKDDFLKGDYLHYELQNAILGTADTQFIGKEGIREIIEKSSETIQNICTPEEKLVVHRFLEELDKQSGLATYGIDAVFNALKNGEAAVVIVTDDTELVEITATCRKCGLAKTQTVNNRLKVQTMREMLAEVCKGCRGSEYDVTEKDIVDILEDAASATNATVEVVSTASDEKKRLKALGGIAAILRYRKSS